MVNFGTATLAPPRSNVFNLRRGRISEDLMIGVGQRLRKYQCRIYKDKDKKADKYKDRGQTTVRQKIYWHSINYINPVFLEHSSSERSQEIKPTCSMLTSFHAFYTYIFWDVRYILDKLLKAEITAFLKLLTNILISNVEF